MKNSKLKIFLITLVLVLMLGIVALYIYDVVVLKTPYTKNLLRMILLVITMAGTILKLTQRRGRRPLMFYENVYKNELGAAFNHKPRLRKTLLSACRMYNESDYQKALKYLFRLLKEAQSGQDAIPVYLFIALCFTDAGVYPEAIRAYYELLKYDPRNSRAHSNLGRLLMEVGDFEQAHKHYDRAIELKPDNYYAYNNRANYYFQTDDYPMAIEDALKALEIKNNGVEAAGLLTIIYALLGDTENQKKYYHIAITSGKRPEELNAAIKYYMSEQQAGAHSE